MLDREVFASCVVPRTKTQQRLEVHAVLRAPLRKWWEEHGSPSQRPVFPVTKGKRKGEARKGRGVSFADRLRRALLVAGIVRHELHHATDWSLPADLHSFRRAFGTAAAESGMNAQQAMHLMAHANLKAHERYVLLGQTQRPRTIPHALVPGIVRQSSGPGGGPAKSSMNPERDTRFELATLSLGSRLSPDFPGKCEGSAHPLVCRDPQGTAGSGKQRDSKGTAGPAANVEVFCIGRRLGTDTEHVDPQRMAEHIATSNFALTGYAAAFEVCELALLGAGDAEGGPEGTADDRRRSTASQPLT